MSPAASCPPPNARVNPSRLGKLCGWSVFSYMAVITLTEGIFRTIVGFYQRPKHSTADPNRECKKTCDASNCFYIRRPCWPALVRRYQQGLRITPSIGPEPDRRSELAWLPSSRKPLFSHSSPFNRFSPFWTLACGKGECLLAEW